MTYQWRGQMHILSVGLHGPFSFPLSAENFTAPTKVPDLPRAPLDSEWLPYDFLKC